MNGATGARPGRMDACEPRGTGEEGAARGSEGLSPDGDGALARRVAIFTDGACSGNPGPGGWGAILRWGDHERELWGSETHTTNNRMELMAAIRALEALKRPVAVDIFTDSEYLRNGITEWLPRWESNGWRTASRKPVKNADLWRELSALAKAHAIEWHWVKGHAGHPQNERADALARRGIEEARGA